MPTKQLFRIGIFVVLTAMSVEAVLFILKDWRNVKVYATLLRRQNDFREIGRQVIKPYQFPVALTTDKQLVLYKEKTSSAFALRVYRSNELVARVDLENAPWGISWNPTGTTVSFLAEVAGRAGVYAPYVWWLTQDHATALNGPSMISASFAIRWSPDGRHISYIAKTLDGANLVLMRVQRSGSAVESVITKVDADAGFAWSPGSDTLVFSQRTASGSVIRKLTLRDLKVSDLGQIADGAIKDLAWSPSIGTIVMSFRGEHDNFYRLALLSISGHVHYCEAEQGDVLSPLAADNGRATEFILENNSNQTVHVARNCNKSVKIFSSEAGSIRLQDDGYNHQPLPIIVDKLDGPAELVQPTSTTATSSSTLDDEAVRSSLNQLWITAPSHPVAAWIWEPPAGRSLNRAVVIVHGGPHLHERDDWQPFREAFRSHGYTVVALNYGGSSGYGKQYERYGDLDSQSDDLIATIQYLSINRKVMSDHITVLASSYGSRVLLRALRREPDLATTIVFAPFLAAPSDIKDLIRFQGTVLAFHGRRDSISNPRFAFEALQKVFPTAVLRGKLYWREFDDEAHGSNRISSIQEEYGTIICAVEPSSCNKVRYAKQ
ncbi:prolyl oligopeptidase family serine peptidase [Granulicella sp. L46]|uniref:S9 family peptidase n=1 Tax=Granulicella sp. L46 TaxID=1641865 RepID=UPI00131DF29C|nr:alpha/beta fold hydrolase [Granulicella sp. L46]